MRIGKVGSKLASTIQTGVIVLGLSMLPCASPGQRSGTHAGPSNEERLQQLAHDKSHTFQDLLNREPQAVANAKEYFSLVKDPKLKQRMASILLSIGVREDIYYNYLATQAKQSLYNDMPWPTVYDEKGNIVPKVMSPEFLAWCKKRNLNPLDEFEAAYYEIPVPWYYLAGSGDPRVYDLLVAGLHSANPMIVTWSARGLTKLQDSRAIDEIIAAYLRSPVETRYDLAVDLLYFKDPKAQAAAEKFINSPTSACGGRRYSPKELRPSSDIKKCWSNTRNIQLAGDSKSRSGNELHRI